MYQTAARKLDFPQDQNQLFMQMMVLQMGATQESVDDTFEREKMKYLMGESTL
jgi:hypothetical protein